MSKGLNESMIIFSDLELPALPYVAPITAISVCQNIDQLYYMHGIVQWSCGKIICVTLKVYEEPLGYADGSPLTLHNHLYSPIEH